MRECLSVGGGRALAWWAALMLVIVLAACTNQPNPEPPRVAMIPSSTPYTPLAPTAPPSATPTLTYTPTATFTPPASWTPIVMIVTYTPSATFTPSLTYTPSDTPTPTDTFTPSPPPTFTPTQDQPAPVVMAVAPDAPNLVTPLDPFCAPLTTRITPTSKRRSGCSDPAQIRGNGAPAIFPHAQTMARTSIRTCWGVHRGRDGPLAVMSTTGESGWYRPQHALGGGLRRGGDQCHGGPAATAGLRPPQPVWRPTRRASRRATSTVYRRRPSAGITGGHQRHAALYLCAVHHGRPTAPSR